MRVPDKTVAAIDAEMAEIEALAEKLKTRAEKLREARRVLTGDTRPRGRSGKVALRGAAATGPTLAARLVALMADGKEMGVRRACSALNRQGVDVSNETITTTLNRRSKPRSGNRPPTFERVRKGTYRLWPKQAEGTEEPKKEGATTVELAS
jgi:hypothetical protein